MKRKLFLIVISVILLNILTSTTCNKGNTYWEIGEVGASFSGASENNFYCNEQYPITDDSIVMQMYITPHHVSSNNYNFSTIKQAQANSPAYPTLNHSISELIISSDHEINGKAIGENLNEFFVLLHMANYNYYDSTWNYYDTLSVQEYVNQYLCRDNDEGLYYNPIFLLKIRPSAKSLVFYFDFINTIGTHYFGKSDTLWVI